VLNNKESAVNQKALCGRLVELGWSKDRIDLIDEDQGLSGKHASGRAGFEKMVADVGLRKVGIILGYEVSRLSRNCADWHRLLELCGLSDTLIGDADGIYDPRDFNDRLLLGLKGTMSEAELHNLRLRLDAGRLSKAKRAELVQHVPTGYIRERDGRVVLDPDTAVQERIRLVFTKFPELGSVAKLLGYLVGCELKLPRRQTSGLYAGDVLWKDPSAAALYSILKNPAYAGAFAYGRRIAEPARQVPGRRSTGRQRKPQGEWIALVKDVYPAYVSWEGYERIQRVIRENRRKFDERLVRCRAFRGGTALLSGLVRCSLCGLHMRVSYKGGRFQYFCSSARQRYGKASCQYVSGRHVDNAVVQEFFEAIKPAHIDAWQRIAARRAENRAELTAQLEMDVLHLEYEAVRAERQFNAVDPENRLVAVTLEKKWEFALTELELAKDRLANAQQAPLETPRISADLRKAFCDVGGRLPDIWPRLAAEAKKSMLRTLVTGVNLLRRDDGTVQVRMAWCGGLATERIVRTPVFSLRHSEAERKVVEKVRRLADEGLNSTQIADRLNREGFAPCRSEAFTGRVIVKLRHRYGIGLRLEQVRRGGLSGGYTVREMAELIGFDPSWIYRKIGEGRIELTRDLQYGCYLFPREMQTIERMKQLQSGQIRQASFRKVHQDG
jgi:DNA invertase Pin-like site-specific DNA recombinase